MYVLYCMDCVLLCQLGGYRGCCVSSAHAYGVCRTDYVGCAVKRRFKRMKERRELRLGRCKASVKAGRLRELVT